MPRQKVEFVRGGEIIFAHHLAEGKTCADFANSLTTVVAGTDVVDVGGWLFHRSDWLELPSGTYRIVVRDQNGAIVCQLSFVKA